MCHVRGSFNIGYLRRRSLTLSCINLGMSHKMLFYMRWMIYIDIECLQFCEGREEFAFFMATMLNAKDVCPSWQKKEKSIPKNMLYKSGPRRLHPLRSGAVSGVEVKIRNCAQTCHHSHIGNPTVSFFFSYDMAGILYIISDRHRILSLYTLNIICIT